MKSYIFAYRQQLDPKYGQHTKRRSSGNNIDQITFPGDTLQLHPASCVFIRVCHWRKHMIMKKGLGMYHRMISVWTPLQ